MSARVRVIVSIVCAASAVALMLAYAASVRGEATASRADALRRYGGETARVCVTTRAVARGEAFSERNVETREWLVDLLPEGAVQDPATILGATSDSDIASNTPVSDVNVDTQAEPLDVPSGTTALSVPCTAESAIGGALAPGLDVDVYVVADGGAQLLCQGARVLATSAGAGRAGASSWVTLAVMPELVEPIIAASSLQKLYLVLPATDGGRAPHAAGQDDAGATTATGGAATGADDDAAGAPSAGDGSGS